MSRFKRYFLISVASLLLDLSFFAAFYALDFNIFQAAIIARLISSIFNFSFNKYYVFQSSKSSVIPLEIILYFFLAISTSLISASIINFLGLISVFFASSGKLLIDSALFVSNYFLQKKIIFKSKA